MNADPQGLKVGTPSISGKKPSGCKRKRDTRFRPPQRTICAPAEAQRRMHIYP